MRVAFVLHLAERDGAGKAFLELLDALRGGTVAPVALVPSGGPLVAELERRGVEVVTVPYRWWAERRTPLWKRPARAVWNLLTVPLVAAVVRSRRCEAIVTNTIMVASGAVAARLLGLPHVWYVHELWGGDTGIRFDLGEALSMRLIDRLSAACLATSKTVAATLAAALQRTPVTILEQSVTLGPDTGPRSVHRPGPETLVCICVGTLHPIKRQDDAVRALGALHRRGVPARLWLVGDGEEQHVAALRRLAESEGVGEATTFFGFQEDPSPLERAADVVLSCCPFEGFGRATVEGMLAGRPVVAARGGGNDELVREGVNGLLYRGGDPADLADALARLAGDPALRARLGEEGRRSASFEFTQSRYGTRMTQILLGVTGRAETP
ncbi:MAG TPA: glycosyltransferase family 4 protein [Thermoanaerobaculaceae bacterium]|nr:glycosyltransferase family 4 protein [Thermoanaerobaculaceae bacterium]